MRGAGPQAGVASTAAKIPQSGRTRRPCSTSTMSPIWERTGVHVEPAKGIFRDMYYVVCRDPLDEWHGIEVGTLLRRCRDEWRSIINRHWLSSEHVRNRQKWTLSVRNGWQSGWQFGPDSAASRSAPWRWPASRTATRVEAGELRDEHEVQWRYCRPGVLPFTNSCSSRFSGGGARIVRIPVRRAPGPGADPRRAPPRGRRSADRRARIVRRNGDGILQPFHGRVVERVVNLGRNDNVLSERRGCGNGLLVIKEAFNVQLDCLVHPSFGFFSGCASGDTARQVR